jgi:hypothetical protein
MHYTLSYYSTRARQQLRRQSAVGIEQCFDTKTENTDARIDAAQLARFRRSTAAAQVAINTQDGKWLAARVRVCKAVYNTGGTIDIIDIASCQLDESIARLYHVTGTCAPKATLPQTDSIDLSQLAIVISAAVTALTLRAARRQPAVNAGLADPARHGMVTPPGTTGSGPGSSVEQMQLVFHELHADGCHALCTVCDGQCRPPAARVAGHLS